MQELNLMAIKASQNDEAMNQLIEQNQHFILKCASKAAHRYIHKSDDEWSLALAAFTEAISAYDLGKGNFAQFAELVIRRRLIDYYRTQSKYAREIAIDPNVFDGNLDEESEDFPLQKTVVQHTLNHENSSIKDEILAVNQVFSHYDFSFLDLTSCSPKAAKTKSECARAIAYLLRNPVLLHELRQTKLLPIKIIAEHERVPRKLLERHRKYIIAAAEILSGDYPCLAGYMGYIGKEMML